MRKIFAVLLLMALSACGDRTPIRIGFIGGTSGRYGDFGAAGRNGAQLAIDQRNAAGGIKGRSLVLMNEDDRQDSDVAVLGFNQLARAGVQAIIGPLTSNMAITLAPLADGAGLVMVSPTVTADSLSGKDDHFFRVVADVKGFAQRMAHMLRDRCQVSKVVLVADIANSDYAAAWGNAFTRAFAAQGGSVLKTLEFDSRLARSYSELAEQALQTKAQFVVLMVSATDAALLAQKLKQKDPNVHIASTGWAGTERLMQLGGRAVEGMLVEQYYDPNCSTLAYRRFREAYMDRFGDEPSFVAALGFDAANVVLEGLAEQDKGQTLKEVLLKNKHYAGLQGEIVFDAFGDTSRAYYTTIVRNGRFQPFD